MLHKWFHKTTAHDSNQTYMRSSKFDHPLSSNVQKNLSDLKKAFHNCSDIVFRTIKASPNNSLLLVYVEGLIDARAIEQNIIKPLLYEKERNLFQTKESDIFPFSKVQASSNLEDVIQRILKSNVAIFTNQETTALIASFEKSEHRQIEEPRNEAALRGPRDGFTESLRVNTSLLRKRIVTPQFKMESFQLGNVRKQMLS